MKRVTILNKKKYLSTYMDKQSVVIRIGDNKPIKDKVDAFYKDVLYMGFIDDEQKVGDIPYTIEGMHKFDIEDKKKIDDFINKYKNSNFIVHCDAGISRSSAIGYYILERLNETDELLEKINSKRFIPNLEIWGVLHNQKLTEDLVNSYSKHLYPKFDKNIELRF